MNRFNVRIKGLSIPELYTVDEALTEGKDRLTVEVEGKQSVEVSKDFSVKEILRLTQEVSEINSKVSRILELVLGLGLMKLTPCPKPEPVDPEILLNTDPDQFKGIPEHLKGVWAEYLASGLECRDAGSVIDPE